MAPDNEDYSMSIAIATILCIGVLLALIAALYSKFGTQINSVWLLLIQAQVAPFAWVDGSDPQQFFEWAGKVDPAILKFEHMAYAQSHAGKWFAYFSMLFFVPALMWSWFRSNPTRFFRRRYGLRELLQRNMEFFPAIIPALRKDLWAGDWYEGKWAIAWEPTRFVAHHSLLLNRKAEPVPYGWLMTKQGHPNTRSPLQKGKPHPGIGYTLDKARAKTLFSDQVGPRFPGIPKLPAYQRGLVAAFLLYGRGHREEAFKQLDLMSRTAIEPDGKKVKKFAIDIGEADKMIDECLKDAGTAEQIEEITEVHGAFTYVWLMGLLKWARTKGKLPTAEFLWLRPHNRTLWYALNAMGGRVAWVEACGPWAHMEAEQLMGYAISSPEVTAAVTALNESMVDNGWLPSPADIEAVAMEFRKARAARSL